MINASLGRVLTQANRRAGSLNKKGHMPLHNFEVGKPFWPGQKVWPDNSAQYELRDASHQLTLSFKRPTKEEIEAVRTGEARFAFGVERGVIFFYYTFAPSFPWGDAPYSIHLVEPAEGRTLPNPDIPAGQGGLLTVFLVDSGDGILKAIRQVGMTNDFTRKLHLAILKQAKEPFDSGEHFAKCKKIQAAYTVKELVRRAVVTMKAGDVSWPDKI
jgi:hypothetical protein